MILGGSGVLPEARRSGAYRALVRVRWERAVELGTPILVIHAGAMSRPILERCGFESVCHLDLLEDPNPLGTAP
jgi:predicted acetyltransferase